MPPGPENADDIRARAIVGLVALVSAVAIVAVGRARLVDLQRFCARRGFAYEFAFAVIWLVLVTSSTVALSRWVRASMGW